MSNAHKLAWCAGFFDGEGFVTIQKRNSKVNDKVYESFYLRIGINHVKVDPLLEMQKILGGTIRKQNPEKIIGNRKQRHSWQMSCSQAKEALIKMMPYFRNKQEVAELGIELQNTMQGDKKKLSKDLHTYRSMLKDLISTLNAKD
jgi:hypothetical protein